jgi:DNA replication and repair protein RecF
MVLESLTIRDFRNIATAELPFSPGLNLFTGCNGQGKSNLLEAVGVLATGRSFRGATPAIMRRHNADWFALKGRIAHNELIHQLDFYGQNNRLSARLNGKPMTALSHLGQVLAAVTLSPETPHLVKGPPRPRRAFLDWVIFQQDRHYATLAREHQKALKARNRLLKNEQPNPRELDAWEDQLAVLGAIIAIRRRTMLQRLNTALAPHLEALALEGRNYALQPLCQLDDHVPWPDESAAAQSYRILLASSRRQDQRRGDTSIGPHRDDLLFTMDGHPLARVGSQGQIKRFALALKLAEAACLRDSLGTAPLFLLDDPGSELDQEGIALFMDILAKQSHQLFLSAREEEHIPWPGANLTRFFVEAGAFHRKETAQGTPTP